MEPGSPALQAGSLLFEPPGKLFLLSIWKLTYEWQHRCLILFNFFFSRITWCPSNLQKVTKRFFFFSVILNSFSFYKFNVSVFLLILTLSHFSRGGPFKLALTSCDPSFLALSHDVLDSSHICIPPHRTGIGQLSKNTKPSWWTVFREHDLGITAGFSETNLDLSCEQS